MGRSSFLAKNFRCSITVGSNRKGKLMFDSNVQEKVDSDASSFDVEALWKIAVTYLSKPSQNRVAALLEAGEVDSAKAAILGGIDRLFALNAMSLCVWQECQAALGMSVQEVILLRTSLQQRLAS